MATDNQEKKISFKDTLNLPQTDFPIRANAKEHDPKTLNRWEENTTCQKTQSIHSDNEQFILHDGPPYANGHLHLGHAYNKILKDIICKSQRMMGKHVPITPGWDCHGLPIELNVKKENPELSGIALKKKCREYAQRWVDIQKSEFKKLGVFMDWDNPYQTMNHQYESSIVKAFGILAQRGYIERKEKTVPWCISCQTVLASAEIEHKEKKDPSIYSLFKLTDSSAKELFSEITQPIYLAVWTTTPWTLPLNQGVMAKPNAEYVILNVNNKYVVVGKQLADKLVSLVETEKNIVKEFNSSTFENKNVQINHPFIDRVVPLILDNEVSLYDGTAFVHCAPESGPIDYEIGIKNNLPIASTVKKDGTYNDTVQPKELIGIKVTEAHGFVIKTLLEHDALFAKKSIKHPYPHCWRCRNPLIFRATKQWFCNLTHNNLKKRALKTIETLTMKPEPSRNRLSATVESRLEWCISRQREWGIPITALICNNCDYTHVSETLIEHVTKYIAQEGIEYWDTVTVDQLINKNFACPKCTKNNWQKETDILDVWFDSGVSHFAVLTQKDQYPADLYLEGKDQHRGWFQSSLLTSLIINDKPCMRSILTHGFTVDQKGHKMSKSLGNVVSPNEMIEKLGTDGLRLWASSIDYAHDAVVSDALIKNITQVNRKIRNTCRFLLSNLFDFEHEVNTLPLEQLQTIDQYALQELFETQTLVIESYQNYEFTKVFQLLNDYCTVNLSSFYLDIIKDRLYVEQADGNERRSAQTTCYIILDALTKLIAPILSFTAEQVADNYQKNNDSVHLQTFANLQSVWKLLAKKYTEVSKIFSDIPHTKQLTQLNKSIKEVLFVLNKNQKWEFIKQVRSELLKAIERKRETGDIKHSLEAKVIIHVSVTEQSVSLFHEFANKFTTDENITDFMRKFLIVSQCEIVNSPDNLKQTSISGLFVSVTHANGQKCPRCWQWTVTIHEHDLCQRCYDIVQY